MSEIFRRRYRVPVYNNVVRQAAIPATPPATGGFISRITHFFRRLLGGSNA